MPNSQEASSGGDRVLSKLGENYLTVFATISSMQGPFKVAIENGDGFEPYHAAEIARLEQAGQRIGYLLWRFREERPVHRAFVYEMVSALDSWDYSRDLWPNVAITKEQQREAIEQALTAGHTDPDLAAA